MQLLFQLSHQIIGRADSNVVADQSRNYLRAKFELLTDDWAAPITVLFNDYAVILDENNECLVPWEVLAQAGKVYVSAFCGDLHTSTKTSFLVLESGYAEGQTPQDPSPNVYLQLTGMVQAAVDTANDVKQRADSGEFNGKDGAPGQDAPQIDDTQASSDHPWSGAKVHAEVTQLQDTIDVILGENAPETFSEIHFAVEQGRAGRYFSVGDQLKPNWADGITSYEDPFDIVHLEVNPELETGEKVHGMMLQQHYANIYGCPFDAQEALYDADEMLPAGTYHYTVAGDTWLTSQNGKVIQFTLTKPVPAGGQIVYADSDGYNQALAGQSVKTYASPTSFTEIETAILSEGSAGTDLGTTDGKGNLNHHQRAFRGCNRWKTSMLRQYLNSSKAAGQWWTKQDKWDRASTFHTTVPGFMAGFDADFLAVIQPVKIQTVRDTAASDGGVDVTYDYFFPISLEQMNAVPQNADLEGAALDYWRQVADKCTENLDNGRFKRYGTYSLLTAYSLNSKSTPRYCWLRSAMATSSTDMWAVGTSGFIYSSNAFYGNHCTPACVIC